MQALLKRISLTLVIVLCSAMVLHAQDNTFTGAVDSNWDLAANWSTGWPPSQHIYQKITIAADCVLPASNTVHYAFHQGSTLQIKVGVSFTNLGTGGWEMYGEIVNEGTYQQTSFNSQGVFAQTGTFVGTLFNDGEITPGQPLNNWACGDPLVYGDHSYATIQLDEQCWMAKNLWVGEPLSTAPPNDYVPQTENGIIEYHCNHNMDLYCGRYGGLYQWDEMMQYSTLEAAQGICPTGWHIPTDDEFKTLEIYLGMSPSTVEESGIRGTNEGSKLAGNTEFATWNSGDLADDPAFGWSGFVALPGGNYWLDEHDGFPGNEAFFWTSTLYDSSHAWSRSLRFLFTQMIRNTAGVNFQTEKYSVRCVKD